MSIRVEKLDMHEGITVKALRQQYYWDVHGQKNSSQTWVQAKETRKTNNGQKRGWDK